MQSCIPTMIWWWCGGSANSYPDEVLGSTPQAWLNGLALSHVLHLTLSGAPKILLYCTKYRQPTTVTVSNYIVSNQLIAGSIMVRHMILILVLSLPWRVYYLMRCTHDALWGVIMNSFDSTISYFACVSCFWQDLQDLMLLGGMCIPLQYFLDFVVS